MLWTVVLWISAGLVLLAAFFRITRWRIYAEGAKMNGPLALPLIGHCHLLLGKTIPDDLLDVLTDMKHFRSPAAVWAGPLLYVFLHDNPEYIKIALNSPALLNKSHLYKFFGMERGLFGAPAEHWKVQRRILNRSFFPAMLRSFVATFNEKDAMFVKDIAKYVGQGEVNIKKEIIKCSLDKIFGTMFGTDADIKQYEASAVYRDAIDIFMELVFKRMCLVYRYPDCIYRLTKDCQTQQKCFNILSSTSREILQERLTKFKQHGHHSSENNNEDELITKPKMNFLDNLFSMAENDADLTESDIQEHIDTMIITGYDTQSVTLSHIVVMLAIHQDVQETVYQEIMQVCPDDQVPVSMEQLGMLSYTEMTIKETLRILPTGPLFSRKCIADVKLDDKYTIPAGSSVMILINLLHRDPKIWGEHADKFNPDHFLPEHVERRHPYAFLPFSGGPRNCIGNRFAMLSMKVFLVYLIRHYRLRTSLTMDNLRYKMATFLRLTNTSISLEKR